jgi:hypothetical protein
VAVVLSCSVESKIFFFGSREGREIFVRKVYFGGRPVFPRIVAGMLGKVNCLRNHIFEFVGIFLESVGRINTVGTRNRSLEKLDLGKIVGVTV